MLSSTSNLSVDEP
jgi:glucose-6-phosphate dehydrogenase assembly protein OpcA